jgi:uncharacterized protein (UPF0264 family)
MRLLVSVRSAEEARAAAAGGADIVDGKNPFTGALGALLPTVVREIAANVGVNRLVSAALGDAASEDAIERDAAAFTAAGAALVKVGFAGVTARDRVEALVAATGRGAGNHRVIAVAYADFDRIAGPSSLDVLEAAARLGVAGILLDTADKSGPGLRHLVSAPALARWVATARAAGLLVALAGKLAAEDLAFVRDAGADIAGVRGAACDGGRGGRVTAERVRQLRRRLDSRPGRANRRVEDHVHRATTSSRRPDSRCRRSDGA